jgi:hypothetical protein
MVGPHRFQLSAAASHCAVVAVLYAVGSKGRGIVVIVITPR